MGGLVERPELNFARSLIRRYRLQPPVDVAALVKQYAQLAFRTFPFRGVDGVSLNLKVGGKQPKVVVNSANPHTRQRFTLAHELGHIIIPWHTGTIIDELEPGGGDPYGTWYEHEQQANAFAAELLMPSEWLDGIIATQRDLGRLHEHVISTCDVSAHAAALNLINRLPRNITYALERDGVVEFSGRTEGTMVRRLEWGKELPEHPYAYVENYYCVTQQRLRIHWWRIPVELKVTSDDTRPWREILDQVVVESGVPVEERHSVKQTIAAVASAANGQTLRAGPRSVDRIVSVTLHMFQRSPNETFQKYPRLLTHPKFEAFVLKRAQDFARGGGRGRH